MRRIIACLLLLAGLLVLAGCDRGPLLSEAQVVPSTITPNGDGIQDATTISYRVGRTSQVSIWLEDAAGARYMLRENALRTPVADPYELRFDGTIPSGGQQRQVLPNGTYRYTILARSDDGAEASADGTITIADAVTTRPEILDLEVIPNPFSPDEDAIDDITNFTYRLPVTATVSINFTDGAGRVYPFVSGQVEGPYTQRHIWDGKTLEGSVLPSGSYTYTITADDLAGNRVVRQGQIAIASSGLTEARITYAQIGPAEIMRGNAITVTVRVKNTGEQPIRTFGPPSGFRYSTNDVYGSVDDHRWADRGGGYWRVGLGYEGNGNAYPFRWALSSKPPEQWKKPGVEDWLDPGEEVEISGSVTILQFEDKMTFFVGLVHEGVSFPATRQAMKVIKVGLQ